MSRTSRRAVLGGAIGGWVVATLPSLPIRNGLIARLRALLDRGERAHATDRALALTIVFGSTDASPATKQMTDAEIGTRIRNNIAADYRDGRLVDFHGWRIAETESQALALLRRA